MPRTFLRKRAVKQRFVALLPAVMLLIPLVAQAQVSTAGDEADAKTAEPGTILQSEPDEVVDEITVIGEKTVTAIKARIIRVDRKMYGLFNEMNTDREYDIHCRLEKVYASNRKKRICLPAFEHGVLEESWEDLSTYTGAERPEAEIRRKREILKQKMIEFGEQNPALKDAIFERAELQRELRKAETRRREINE